MPFTICRLVGYNGKKRQRRPAPLYAKERFAMLSGKTILLGVTGGIAAYRPRHWLPRW